MNKQNQVQGQSSASGWDEGTEDKEENNRWRTDHEVAWLGQKPPGPMVERGRSTSARQKMQVGIIVHSPSEVWPLFHCQ